MRDLYWLDLETTGLDPSRDAILEIAVAKASLEDPCTLEIILEKVIYPDPWGAFLGMQPVVHDMHIASGLWEACIDSEVLWEQVVEELERLIPSNEELHLAGANVGFDLRFLEAHAPKIASRFHHRLYDTDSISLFCQGLGMPPFRKLHVHQALADIFDEARCVRECVTFLSRRFGGALSILDLPLDIHS